MHTQITKRGNRRKSGSAGPKTAAQTAVATDNKNHSAQFVSADEIRLCAYRKWESAGRPNGDGVQFWLEAEREMLSNINSEG